MKKRNFIISWEIYPFDVMVSIGEKQEDVVKRINKTTYKLNDTEKEALWMTGAGRTVMLEGGQTIMRLDSLDPAVLAHEVFHAVNFLMDRVRIKLGDNSDEAFAYAIQYLTKEIYKKIGMFW